MQTKPNSNEARRLLFEGTLALGDATRNGIRVDMNYLEAKIPALQRRVKTLRLKLDKTDLVKKWRKKYGNTMNWESNDQLADILYNEMGFTPKRLTNTGKGSTDQSALESLQLPEVEKIIKINRLVKAGGTFLSSIRRETTQENNDYFLHPFFKLLNSTYRSSSTDPNFQNFPKRVPEIMKLIRRCFIPREGHYLVGVDFSKAEICAAYCYHKDPAMYNELTNKKHDMHRDMGAKCFKLRTKDMGKKGSSTYKNIRHCGKNSFVFPQFYGDWYKSCAAALWDAIHMQHLTKADGTLIQDHLAAHGIEDLETFESHIQKVERHFWKKRFPVYDRWKAAFIKQYERRGYVDMLSGFRCYGYMRNNQVINYPVQGFAFHWLLWSFIELNNVLVNKNWISKIIGQIHDEIVADVHESELDDFVSLATEIMTVRLPKAWRAVIEIPLAVETEISEINGNWAEMKEYKNG